MELIVGLEARSAVKPEVAEYFALRLKNARQRRDELIREYLDHLRGHGCQDPAVPAVFETRSRARSV